MEKEHELIALKENAPEKNWEFDKVILKKKTM